MRAWRETVSGEVGTVKVMSEKYCNRRLTRAERVFHLGDTMPEWRAARSDKIMAETTRGM
jgi:hypothetical protein